ncbi:MAG: serine protease [Candidatus Bathyarchaeota archaeon]|nr:serine protease [Candidatus Bathyarchaeota archaeon]
MSNGLLKYEEKRRLIKIITGLYAFIRPRSRYIFIKETAGLGRFALNIDLSGTPGMVVTELVSKLEKYGQLPERPKFHALGALLDVILDIADTEVPQDDKIFIAGLIVQYSLIADSDYISKLCNDYSLPDYVIQPPSFEVSPPITREKISSDPEFEVVIDDEKGLESVINSEDNFLNIHLLYGGIYCSHAVGQIEIPEGTAKGTGFLVGPNLMLTNQHVIKKKKYLQKTIVRFGYINDLSNIPLRGNVFNFQPNVYHFSPAEELDYALVRLTESPLKDMSKKYSNLNDKSIQNLVQQGIHKGYLILVDDLIAKGARVNIIQHPRGGAMKIVMTQNYVVNDMKESRVHYVSDTMDGSSGAPVFNKKWEVVALHHSGKPYPPDSVAGVLKRAWKGKFRVNEGIPMRAILEDFHEKGISDLLPKS